MIPILYDSTETEFVTEGLGRLSDATSCTVEENRNGTYELAMKYPANGIHADEIIGERIICAVPSEGSGREPFRIYNVDTSTDGHMLTINARHISYDLSKCVVMPFTASSAAEFFSKLKANIIPNTCPFTFETDKETEANFELDIPSSARAILGGQSPSFLDTYGTAEYEFTGYRVIAHLHRGEDRGVSIEWGKNLTKFEEVKEQTEYNAIIPYYPIQDSMAVTGDLIKLDTYDSSDRPMIKPVDVTEYWSDSENAPTAAQVTALGEKYAKANGDSTSDISQTITIKFVTLWQTEEYKNIAPLERIHLCDTVHVFVHFDDEERNRHIRKEYTAKCTKTVYNVLKNRYDSMDLGDASTNLSDAISDQISSGTKDLPTKSFLAQAQANAAKLITGGLGGQIYIRRNANGKPIELIIAQANSDGTVPESYEDAERVWRFNSGGLGYFPDGYSDNPDASAPIVAMTSDGAINADVITTGTLNANIIRAGILQDLKGLNYWNLETGEFSSTSVNTAISDETTRATTAESELSAKITANADNITAEVNRSTKAEENLSSRIALTATGIDMSVTNGDTSSGITITMTREDGTTQAVTGTIAMTGLVSFTDLSGSGTTTINGDNITTGKIKSTEGNSYWDLTTGDFVTEGDDTGLRLKDGVIYATNNGENTGASISVGTDGYIWFDGNVGLKDGVTSDYSYVKGIQTQDVMVLSEFAKIKIDYASGATAITTLSGGGVSLSGGNISLSTGGVSLTGGSVSVSKSSTSVVTRVWQYNGNVYSNSSTISYVTGVTYSSPTVHYTPQSISYNWPSVSYTRPSASTTVTLTKSSAVVPNVTTKNVSVVTGLDYGTIKFTNGFVTSME